MIHCITICNRSILVSRIFTVSRLSVPYFEILITILTSYENRLGHLSTKNSDALYSPPLDAIMSFIFFGF